MVVSLEAETKPVVNLPAACYNYPPRRLTCKEKILLNISVRMGGAVVCAVASQREGFGF